ncbi:MAG TPA: ABC transporter ATP-binding protein [Cyclobacteriaceae bacterium]|jgi:ATP-binding cassette subfamily B protein
MKELSYLNKYLLKYKYHFILGIIFTIITNIFQIIPAQMVRHSLDLIIANIDLYRNYAGLNLQNSYYDIFARYILIYGGIILLMALLRGFFLFLVRQTLIVMSRLIEYDLKNEIYRHYQELPTSFYRRNSTGDLMNRISEDVSKVRMYLGPSIMYGINLITLFAILIPYMLTISVKLTLFALLPLPILSFSIYFVNNIINRRSEAIQKQQSKLSTFVQEAFSGIRVLKSFVREEDSSRKFEEENTKYKNKSLRLTMVNSLFFPIVMALIGLSVILTVFVGGNEVISGALTFGNIAEFILYVNYLTWPVTALGWISSITQRAAASQRRINEFMLVKNDITSEKNIQQEIRGDIEFNGVSFTYPDSGIVALSSLDFKLNSGESLAIIGTTGSGKSTVANLLCRLYDPTEGKITIDEINLKDYHLGSIRSQIGYVPQDVFLFSDTIFNNIAFGSMEIPPEKVMQAARDADLYGNVMDFPDQFNTRVGERGITLSGGQKQRVSIARAIVRDPKILILDDSLSAVDTKTENTILKSMKLLMKDRTTIIISHRVSSAKLADKIIVLDDGVIVEQGTNESLLKSDGVYRSLYEKQLLAEELLED